LILNYIQNPVSVITGLFTLYTINSNDYYESSSFALPSLQAGSFLSINFLIDQLQIQFPYTNYTVVFTTSKYIPVNSKILVTFPPTTYDFTLAYCTGLSSTLQG